MGKPAAHIGSAHTCPAVTGKIPHVGGPVAAGSPNVFVGGMPAARQGDMCVCVGPPDSIAAGSSGVFINGKPAARQGDGTSHGGSVASGNPTVLIGEKGGGSSGGSSKRKNSGSSLGLKNRKPPENNKLAEAEPWGPVPVSLTSPMLENFSLDAFVTAIKYDMAAVGVCLVDKNTGQMVGNGGDAPCHQK